MHSDREFADTPVRFGDCAHTAVQLGADTRDESKKLARLERIIRAMARFFCFTAEFGLMRGPGGTLKAYGSGLLSSYGEIAYAIESSEVPRQPVQLEWVINQAFEI